METRTERIAIDGMTCGSCIRHVRAALQNISDLEVSDVDLRSAEVRYDPNKVERDRIIEAIEEEGYTVASTAG